MEDLDVGFQHGTIRLEEIPAVYYSGQVINGSVVFDLKRPLTFSTLSIQYLGEANVLWTETEVETVQGVRQVKETKYQSHEVYFNEVQTLAGGYGTAELPRTYQSFPFRFQIPFTSPSSFKGERGSVTYSITATMVYPDMTKEEIKKEFDVVAPLDLNTGNPSIKEPTELVFSDEVMSCCVCIWSSHSVTINIKLPVTGYCPGQVIPALVEVENLSGVEILKFIFEVITRELYRSRQPPSEFVPPEKVLTSIERGAVMAHSKKIFKCDVPVPKFIPANLENCSVIDIGYFFRATIKLSGCNDDLQDDTEICLGLVPINEMVQGTYRHPMAHCLPSAPIPEPPTFNGSTTPINRSRQNIAQNSQDYPPPYPVDNIPYRADNKVQYPTKPDRAIGFVTEETDVNPPPYPGGTSSSGYPPYRNSGGINIPLNTYPQGGNTPSAPPL